ncbi:hypothetical protein ACDQ55_16870 [Chitinophaga sp. 30R24]|uniref:hypothetical protein n=1 Tax=Chitinophaga sp. 30R24 TaxID=3248838 RepID=UPI003B91E9D6
MKPFFYKCCVVLCITGMLSIFIFSCNGARETGQDAAADSAAVTMPRVDSTSVVPVDTSITKPDSMHM